MSWTKWISFLLSLLFFNSCKPDHRKEIIASVMEINNYVYDRSVEGALDTVIHDLNCVISETGYYFSKEDQWKGSDQKQIIVIPFTGNMTDASTGTTQLEE